MKKWFVFHVIFKILLTVFNQSYNCQTSDYLGRNRLPKPFLICTPLPATYYTEMFNSNYTQTQDPCDISDMTAEMGSVAWL